jgi:heptosyltransferase-1
MKQFLIVKTSSLGDILHTFPVLFLLRELFPDCLIDWVVEKKFVSIVEAHPLVRKAIVFHRLRPVCSTIRLRKVEYDSIFDLQGNTKSAWLTFFARGKEKVGFAKESVREWPNLWVTNKQFNVSKKDNIRDQYLSIVRQTYQQEHRHPLFSSCSFQLSDDDRNVLTQFNTKEIDCFKVMVCPGSQWENKKLSIDTMISFLNLIQKEYDPFFFFMWGQAKEKEECEKISQMFAQRSVVVPKLSFIAWQHFMKEMDLMIGMDSSALHLCATTSTPTFSIFGPTIADVFKPLGAHHHTFQGVCPYQIRFEKQCPSLRTCSTGACIKKISSQELFCSFSIWWNSQLALRQKMSSITDETSHLAVSRD